jgi:two-component system phosphate regulon sensor histidine kinase PhoR
MVESLLNGAKLEHGELKTDLTKVELIYEINKIIEKYKIVTDKNTGSIKLKSNNEKIFFNTDRFCFNNIINNIIDNAVKYCSVSPNVFINVIEFESNIKIMIEDNGYGIEKKYMKEIFEPFFRVPTGNIYKGKGYGLGLSYVKKSVEALKGEIFVESVINKGTTFTIILPKL